MRPFGYFLVACCQTGRTLMHSPRELWIVYALKLFNSFGLFAALAMFFIFITDEFHYTYTQAGYVVGSAGLVTSLANIACGNLIDRLGVRLSYVLGATCGAVGTLMLTFAGNEATLYISLFFFLPLGMALGIPVLGIGVKRYTFAMNRTLAFGLFYVIMNIGATFSFLVVDEVRARYKEGIDVRSYHATACRLIFAMAGIITLVSALFAALTLRDIRMDEKGEIVPYDRATAEKDRNDAAVARVGADGVQRTWLGKLVRDAFFWRLVAFQFVLLGVTMVFRHMDNTFPVYLTNTLGKDARFGDLKAINPIMVTLLVPVFSRLLQSYDIYNVMIAGSAISALSVFIMCGEASYARAAWFFVIFSIGEAIYSPRAIEYVMILSPNGNEGAYSALAYAPLFMAKFGADILSGNLLAWYCPPGISENCQRLWLAVAFMALASPAGLFLLKRFIHSVSTQLLIDTRNNVVGEYGPFRRVDVEEEDVDEGADVDVDGLTFHTNRRVDFNLPYPGDEAET